MKITEHDLEKIIDRLNLRIVPKYQSDNVLLIFEDKSKLSKYILKNKFKCPDKILMTIDDIINNSCSLDGIRYKRYEFITNKEMK